MNIDSAVYDTEFDWLHRLEIVPFDTEVIWLYGIYIAVRAERYAPRDSWGECKEWRSEIEKNKRIRQKTNEEWIIWAKSEERESQGVFRLWSPLRPMSCQVHYHRASWKKANAGKENGSLLRKGSTGSKKRIEARRYMDVRGKIKCTKGLLAEDPKLKMNKKECA